MNIADLPSRGCSAKNLAETKWWNGPEWLRKNSEFWPKSEISCSEEELLSERRKSITSSVVHETEKFTKHFDYFSKYSKIVRMITWIFRFYFNVKDKNERNSGELTCEEVEKSETCLLRMIQHESFGKMNTDVVQNLEVMKDGNGMLRVKTKLLLSEDNEDFKYPILLPHHHNIVHRLIFEQHCLSCHAGLKTLLAILRERFWILKARRTIKQVISKCIVCKRYNQKSVETPFAPLPANRINNAATFEVSGMDYAGPLFLKGGEKAWFLLFTCAVYRAIHFELVTSLSTESFLRALRRFIARRGRVSTIYSDNGTSFVGANNLLKRIDWEEIMKFSSVKRIRWIFNVPTAAWWGGWWERLVRITKELLRRNLGKASVTYEELMTLLCDCEMIINSRPLTYISNDDELIPLSPLQFLQSIPTSEVPDLDTIDREYLLGRQRYLQNVRDNLRGRFRKEYLAELVHHGHRKVVSIQPGDIVLVEVDNKKRVNWPLAKVLEIFPGKDNLSRVAKVKLSGGELFRPFQRLFPLEIPAPNNEEIRGTVIHQKKIDKKLKFDSKLKEEIDQEPNPDPEYTASKLEKQIVTTRCGRLVKVPKRFGV